MRLSGFPSVSNLSFARTLPAGQQQRHKAEPLRFGDAYQSDDWEIKDGQLQRKSGNSIEEKLQVIRATMNEIAMRGRYSAEESILKNAEMPFWEYLMPWRPIPDHLLSTMHAARGTVLSHTFLNGQTGKEILAEIATLAEGPEGIGNEALHAFLKEKFNLPGAEERSVSWLATRFKSALFYLRLITYARDENQELAGNILTPDGRAALDGKLPTEDVWRAEKPWQSDED